MFHADSYKTIWPEGRKPIRLDAIFPSMYTAYQENHHKFDYEVDHVFWSPCCIDVQDHGVDKDIDVFFWGNPGASMYPFRNFVLRELTKYSYLEHIEDQLIVNTLRLAGSEYSYARLPRENAGCWGTGLYPMLERARICPTGSAFCHVPVARYFENAACGVVTLTNDFSDRQELGFMDGVHLVTTAEKKFIVALRWLIQDSEVVEAMASRTRQLIEERHTVAKRAMELYTFLEEVI
jgi:hypothetical protein